MAHLFVDISAHGLGHLAQAAPILNAVHRRRPELRLSLRSGVPLTRLQARIEAPFTHFAGQSDFGFAMHDATRLDLEASAVRYREWHADWPARVAAEAAFLRQLAPDLVLTDVAYLPLAGARQAGLTALSMCSLNWADLFWHVFGKASWAVPIHAEILAAYRGAAGFLRLTPAMPMPDLPHTRAVGPVAAVGTDRRQALRARLGMLPDSGERVVLIAFGGFDKAFDAATWPATPGIRWLVPAAWGTQRPDMTAIEALAMNFTDLLRSVDAVVTKPGYGTFTEAACNGTAVFYLRRDDWPEQDCLIAWLEENARCLEVTARTLVGGGMGDALARLYARPAPPPPAASGAEEAAALLAGYLP